MTLETFGAASRHARTALTLFAASALLVTTAGCTKRNIKEAVREGLIDPDSAKFGKIDVEGKYACVQVNAKNKMGGYTGMSSIPVAKAADGKWTALTGYGGNSDLSQEICLSVIRDMIEHDKNPDLKDEGSGNLAMDSGK